MRRSIVAPYVMMDALPDNFRAAEAQAGKRDESVGCPTPVAIPSREELSVVASTKPAIA